ncbi:5'-nucleotidase C-terminal domain-containing protein [Clostridium sp. DJ247]|uniref:5'-nucleotidase C-terminal domain-containing protein n=1 Tax=Clostridium sp. DJ247 TaxID=2726188 RepID=UPI00162AAE49|nr:5'-nucleotidase C-terminal domain-containing protein [Clostridium sp. DJ247]MBC2581078.1 LPXTG cell wall anchor domain-containing protein [Clostridium sp. DJ247]
MLKNIKKSKKFMSLALASAMTLSLIGPVSVKAETNSTTGQAISVEAGTDSTTGQAINLTGDTNAVVSNSDEYKTIDIVSFNDFHGNLAEDPGSTGKNPGMAKLVAAINEHKEANPNTVVVSAGDNYQGSAMSNLTYGAPVSAMMKQLGVVASSVGNHEFDWGVDRINQWTKDGNFDYLASNIYDKTTGEPVTWAKPYKMVTVDGLKIGFVGLTTPETAYKTKPDNVATLEFRDPAASAEVWADKLKSGKLPEGKADVVIALTHMGTAQDSNGNITGEVVDSGLCNVDSIDAVISAHTHNTVSGTVNNKPVVQAWYAGRALGYLSITVDKTTGIVQSIVPNVDNISKRKSQLVPDSIAEETYNDFNTEVKPILDDVKGFTDTDLTHDRFSEGTSLLGQWTTDVMRKAVGVQIGITNGGGLRVPIPAGSITMGTLYTVMPFDNTLVKMDLKGSDLKRVIENGIANGSVGWVQVSGVKVYYDKSAPKGNRITAMFLEDGTPIDMNKSYSVVTNDFMYTGGDKYDFTGATNVLDTGIPIRDSLASALEAMDGKHLSVKDAMPLVNGPAPVTTLPKTGSVVSTSVLIEIGAAAIMLGFILFIAGRKKKEEQDAA